MSNEFFNDFWPYFISIITVVSVLACYALLHANKTVEKKSKDNTTGHVWDEDLKEMNNPLPRWWMGLFIITIIFGLIYLWLYPGLPVHKGSLNWDQASQYDEELQENNSQIATVYAKYKDTKHNELALNEEAMKIGQSLFLNNCAQCHGSDARGSIGFPNLTDHDWLYGGEINAIKTTIKNGRNGVMPPMGMIGNDKDIEAVAHYVISLSGGVYNPGLIANGRAKFGACAACHGADGKGNQQIGAPNLTDNIWLHGTGVSSVVRRIKEGKNNMMPAWSSRLSEEQIHILASYVWSLSNNK